MGRDTESRTPTRLLDLLGALSLAVDLGIGQESGHVARSTVVATRLAERAGLDREERQGLVQVALMGWVGCIADSRDAAVWFGDDIAYRAGVYDLDMAPLPFLGYLLRHAGTGQALPVRAARKAGVLADRGRAALLHTLGRIGVPNTLWDAPGPLSTGDVERLRLAPYYTGRILAHSPLAEFSERAVREHARIGGFPCDRVRQVGAIIDPVTGEG